MLLDAGAGLGVGVEVGDLAEEVGTETLMGVVKNAVLVLVVSGGGVLGEELNLPDEVSLGTLGGGGLLGLLIVRLGELFDLGGLNLAHGEGGSESVSVKGLSVMEQVVEGGEGEVGVLLVDLRHGDGVSGDGLGEGSLLGTPVVGDLLDGGSESGGGDESHDVGVVGKGEDVLLVGGLVPGGGSDSNSLASSQVGELELEGKSVPRLTSGVSKLELVGVFVHLVHLGNLSNNIEVVGGAGDLGEGLVEVLGDGVVRGEVLGGPSAEGTEELGFVLLEGSSLSGEGERLEFSEGSLDIGNGVLLVGGEERPGTVPVGADVELSLTVVEAEGGSVETDDVSDSAHDGHGFEFVSVDDGGGVVVIGGLGTGGVKGGVDNLEGANVFVLVGLVGESSVNDHTVDVVDLRGGEGHLVEFGVLVTLTSNTLLDGFGRGRLFLSGSSSGHCMICFGWLGFLKKL